MGKALVKIKPKKYKVGDIVKVDFIAIHPMETGMRKSKKTGKILPAKYINEVKFYYNGKLFTNMDIWESTSTNPYLSVNLKITEPGEVKVTFKDNTGEAGEKSKKIKPRA
ncbi:MAG: thiosulfate oxidation carrier complex protein SoxZ [Sulfurospirillum sp.]|nr:MAG: thiosulfate oxidation carrier complex protein SoxZ [Sulfurospirillum sp.]